MAAIPTNSDAERSKPQQSRSRRLLSPLRTLGPADAGQRATPAPEFQRITRYVHGGRVSEAPVGVSIAEAFTHTANQADDFTFFLFPKPTEADIVELADAFDLHHVLVEDLLRGGQRPKLERYGDVLFVVVRAAHYIDNIEDVRIAEFHILLTENAIAVLCQDARWIDGTDDFTQFEDHEGVPVPGRISLLRYPELLQLGPEAVLYQLLDEIVDRYTPVLRGISIDKEQIETQVFSGDPKVAERIYRLSQEVIDLQHATSSLTEVLGDLGKGFKRYGIPEQLKIYLQDVSDHLARVETRAAELRDALTQILSVNATLVSQRQSEDMKKISSWAAILFAPTLIGAVYGMNFDEMPELHWQYGYPLAVGGMIALGGVLFFVFKRKKWM